MGVTADFLTMAKIPFWLDYGTLMGAVCNPLTTWADYPWLEQSGRTTPGPAAGIIPHDKDADIGVEMKHWELARRGLRAVLIKNRLYAHINPNRRSIKARLSARNHTNVDVFFWRERPNGVMYRDKYASVDAYKGREFHKSMLFPLSTVTWEGMTLPAPRDPEAFLEMRYGADWRTPVMANNKGVKR